MKALQLHYTSCRKGRSGHAGFQTRSLTPGIELAEQQEIERRGNYTPPRDAPPEPTREEIAGAFPRALRYYLLGSGRFALTLSCYQGQDYTRRFGNFFAHTLVGAGRTPPCWPIDYYEWEGWKDHLPVEEDTEEPPPLLPAVDLLAIPPAGAFALPELQIFLTEVAGRREALGAILRAILAHASAGRPVVIRDTFLNGLFWVACAQKAFARSCVGELSFSTYQHHARDCARINVTVGDTDLARDEADRRFRYFVFDFTSGQHSEVPALGGEYAGPVVRWMAEAPERLEAFHAFVDSLPGPPPLHAELRWAVLLFQVDVGEAASLTTDELRGLFEFATPCRAAPGVRNRVLGLLARAVALLAPGGSAEVYAGAWQDLLGCLRDLGREPAWGQPEARALLLLLMAAPGDPQRVAARVLAGVGADEVALATLCEQLCEQRPAAGAQQDPRRALLVGRALAQVLSSCPPKAGSQAGPGLTAAVRQRLAQRGLWSVLLGEWQAILHAAADPLEAYRRYCDEVMAPLPGMNERMGAQVAWTLSEVLPAALLARQALLWLESGAAATFPPDLAGRCVKAANHAIPLDPAEPVSAPAMQALSALAARLDVPLQPDYPGLRQAIRLARDRAAPLARLPLSRMQAWLAALDAEQYRRALDLFLLPALGKAKSGGDHHEVVCSCLVPAHRQVFQERYLALLPELLRDGGTVLLEAAVLCWCAARDVLAGAELRQGALRALVKITAGLDDAALAALLQRVDASLPAEAAQGRAFRAQVEARRASAASAWSRVKGIFTRKPEP